MQCFAPASRGKCLQDRATAGTLGDGHRKFERVLTMDSPRRALADQFVSYVKELRFPWLLAITLAIFLIDLVVLDFIPFADEIVLGLLAAVLATLKKRRREQAELSAAPEEPRLEPPASDR